MQNKSQTIKRIIEKKYDQTKQLLSLSTVLLIQIGKVIGPMFFWTEIGRCWKYFGYVIMEILRLLLWNH